MGAALYVCRNCGREAADHLANLADMREHGFVSCCPDRDVVQVGPCLFPQRQFIKLSGTSVLTGAMCGSCVREDFEDEQYLFGVRGLDAPSVLPSGGAATFKVPGSANEYLAFYVMGGRYS